MYVSVATIHSYFHCGVDSRILTGFEMWGYHNLMKSDMWIVAYKR